MRVHDDEAWAIAEGRHGDPFKVLGPQNGQLAVWAPGAVTLELKQGRGKPVPLAEHPGCPQFYEGPVDPAKPYTLVGTNADGVSWNSSTLPVRSGAGRV
ncbi:MAG: hypothetical protein R3D59_06170 [Paracoccaceae bacterium]